MTGTEFRNALGPDVAGAACTMPLTCLSVSGRQRLEGCLDGGDVRALCRNGRLESGDVRVHAKQHVEAEPRHCHENRDDPRSDSGDPAQPDPLFRDVSPQFGNVSFRRDATGDGLVDRFAQRFGLRLGKAGIGQPFHESVGVESHVHCLNIGPGREPGNSHLHFRFGSWRALPAALAVLLALPFPVLAQATSGGTLGIDCEKPRWNADGTLVLAEDGAQQALCEADRSTALTYAGVVRETRDRLRAALAVLPPPVWDDLVNHLRTNDAIDAWTYADPAIMARLLALSTCTPTPPPDPGEVATCARAHGLVQHWGGGILAESGVEAAWRGLVQARACGVGPGARILVWLDPGVLRDRWTPAMVQRTVRAWLESQNDRFVAGDRIPDVVTATRQLSRADGIVRDISGDPAVQACFASVPDGALAMSMTLSRSTDRGRRAVGCDVAGEVGLRRFAWTRQNGVFIVPQNAILPDGSDHPDRGEPLLGQNAGLPRVTAEPLSDPTVVAPQPGEFLVATTCRAPRTVDAVRVEDCDAEINGQTVQGVHVLRVRFREVQNDPVDPLRIDLVPVGPDPLDPGNELGVIAPPGPHPIWETTTLFCDGQVPARFVNEVPQVSRWQECTTPADCDGWIVPSCSAEWGGSFDEGHRIGLRQIETYPPGWPVDEVEVRRIDDYCFNPRQQNDAESRTGAACEVVATTSTSSTGTVSFSESVNVPSTRQIPDPDWEEPDPCNDPEDPANPNHANCGQTPPLIDEDYLDPQTVSQSYTDTDPNAGVCDCPAGWSGSITQERDFQWRNRIWAVPHQKLHGTRNDYRAQWSVGQVAGFYDATATTDALSQPIGWLPELPTDPPDPPGMPPEIRLIRLTADWHEETNTCTPPAPSSSDDGDSDSPWGYQSYLDGQVYERPAADGTSVGVNQDPSEHGSAPSASTGEYDYSGF